MRLPIASEHAEQCLVIEWWARAHKTFDVPEFSLFAIPNGGARHPAVAAKLKAEGVRRGVPDLMLAVPVGRFHGLYVEMKRSDGGRTTGHQDAFAVYLVQAGYEHHIASGFDEARAAIHGYLRPLIARIARPMGVQRTASWTG